MGRPRMEDLDPSGLRVSILAVILLALPALAGCTTPDPSQEAGPDFTAWFLDLPDHRPTYQEIGETLHVRVRNEGDAGTEQICIEVDGVSTGCQSASLVPGEETTLELEVQPENGTHQVTVLNASGELDVEPLPRIGEWINGSLVDLRVVDGHEVNETTAWNWTVEARYHNGSQRLEMIRWEVSLTSHGIRWPTTQHSWEGTFFRPIKGRPLAAEVWVQLDENSTGNRQIDDGLFRWRWPSGI